VRQVLFVCLGNICRSPMAHGVMSSLVDGRGWGDEVLVDSAGTGAHHLGEPPDRRTLAVLRRHGLDLEHHARQVRDADFERFDWILAMDKHNLAWLRERCPEPRLGRLALVTERVGGADVDDPYYGGMDGFERCYAQLVGACSSWLPALVAPVG
jgi:protein-tyrosine phosphatase